MRRYQSGITFLGWLVLLVPVAMVGYVAIRIVPSVLNYTKVIRVLDQTQKEYAPGDVLTREVIKASIEKRFDVDYVDTPKIEDVSIRREGEGWTIEAAYEDVIPLIANASLLLTYEKTVIIK